MTYGAGSSGWGGLYGYHCQSIAQTGERVTTVVSDSTREDSRSATIESSYVIGADGAAASCGLRSARSVWISASVPFPT